jgi:hypothetical protein
MTERVCHVIRIRRRREVRRVALMTISVHELIVAAHMAGCTWRSHVHPRERELGCAVIKRRRLPGGRRVALCAGLRKCQRHMIWIRRCIVISPMTIDAIRGQR